MPRPARILVIDDEPGIVKLVSYALSGEGFQVVSAARMEAALLEFEHLVRTVRRLLAVELKGRST